MSGRMFDAGVQMGAPSASARQQGPSDFELSKSIGRSSDLLDVVSGWKHLSASFIDDRDVIYYRFERVR